jgi:hypothetical protein
VPVRNTQAYINTYVGRQNKCNCVYFEKRVANLTKFLEAGIGSEESTSDHQFIVVFLSLECKIKSRHIRSTSDIFSYSSFTIISHFRVHYIKYIVGKASLNKPMINKLNSVHEYYLKLYSARKAWRRLDPFSTQ